ncbi:sulfotransferase domain-containing protein [Synechococcus sp. A15-62]|uniref:sulfotransferase domain-containing protein n=1 Tax=Synechococcus sp. A15-62 TaxID=1050657 RepID=UPI001644285D|nr:sulfotransferase domain-containing protein [Synechococcus sp. A15-62]
MQRAGSSMLNTILSEYFSSVDLQYGNPEDAAFVSEIGPSSAPGLYLKMLSEGLKLFIGFRGLPDYAKQELCFSDTKVVFLIRHPLDILVSRYYQFYKVSDGGHTNPGNQDFHQEMINIGEKAHFVEKEQIFLEDSVNVLSQYIEINDLLSYEGASCQVYNYESFLFNKPHLFSCMMNHMGLPVNSNEVIRSCKCSDKYIKPGSNLTGQHVRHMYPGDYLNHMDQDLINQLSDQFREIVRPLGYLL